jgi:hypothetical protein
VDEIFSADHGTKAGRSRGIEEAGIRAILLTCRTLVLFGPQQRVKDFWFAQGKVFLNDAVDVVLHVFRETWRLRLYDQSGTERAFYFPVMTSISCRSESSKSITNQKMRQRLAISCTIASEPLLASPITMPLKVCQGLCQGLAILKRSKRGHLPQDTPLIFNDFAIGPTIRKPLLPPTRQSCLRCRRPTA